MELLERIRTLADASGVSGNEAAAAQTALEMLREFCPDAVYENGNVMGHLGVREPGKPHVLVDAHIDQIGMIVTDIEENGFLRIGNVGGLDRRLMPAQSVIIHGKEPVRGVICTIPPHLSGGKDAPVPKMEELAVDTGYSREQVSALVSRGDFVQYDTSCMPLLDTRLTGAALDDRCGVAADAGAFAGRDAALQPDHPLFQPGGAGRTGGKAGCIYGESGYCPGSGCKLRLYRR